MKEVRYSTRARKDLKRYRRDEQKMRELFNVLHSLAKGEELAPRYRAHMLSGNFKGCMECHVGNDFFVDMDRNRCDICRTYRLAF